MGILLFILIFCVVVVAHEFGHFIIAKANGIHVVEFSIGMGPTLWHVDKGDTRYSIKLLPIGGACMFEGEDGMNTENDGDAEGGDEEEKDVSSKEEMGTLKKSGAFPDASVWARIATVVAGPVFNFILAFVFSAIIVGSIGSDVPVIGQVGEGSAAEEAGLMEGDRIVKLNGKSIHLFREISFAAMLNEGEPVDIVYERDGQENLTTLQPKYMENPEGAGRYYYGIAAKPGYTKFGPLGVIKYSVYEVKYWIDTTIKSIGMLFNGKAGVKDLSGPVGMANVVDDIYTESKEDGAYYVWLNMLNFAILLSANLGVLNLIPFPALDGGRLLFLIIEAIRRKPIPPEKEGIFHFVGFALLMILMVVVMYNDIARLVTGG